MATANTTEQDFNSNVRIDAHRPEVGTVLKLIEDAKHVRRIDERIWEDIQTLYENGFSVEDPSGTRRFESNLLWLVINRVVSRMKLLDTEAISEGVDPEVRKVVADGVTLVMDEGGFLDVMTKDFGTFHRMLLYGDAFINMGTSDVNEPFPMTFRKNNLMDVYVDPFANEMRNKHSERDVDEIVARYVFSWDEIAQVFPGAEKVAAPGNLPTQEMVREKIFKNKFLQWQKMESKRTEVAYYYNKARKEFFVVIGGAATLWKNLKGDDYPFIMDKKSYIPFLHFVCFPSPRGFYNWGLGHLMYRLAIVTRQLINKGVNYAMDNVDPIRIVLVPRGQRGAFFNRLKNAHQLQAEGKKGIVPLEVPAGVPSPIGDIKAMNSEQLTSEFERLINFFDKTIQRLGVNLDDRVTDPKKTLGALELELGNVDAFISQIMEQNADEFKFAREVTIDFIKQFVKNSDDTPLTIASTMRLSDGTPAELPKVTMGMLSEELKKTRYRVKVNARSGSVQSGVLAKTRIQNMLPFMPPGSEGWKDLIMELGRLNNLNLNRDNLGMMPQEEVPAAAPSQSTPTL